MSSIYIGIDPSINSTGICIQTISDDNKVNDEKFYIIKPNSLTKHESSIKIDNFSYVVYSKSDLTEFKNDYHKYELNKTLNIINLINQINSVISKHIKNFQNVFIVMEGISYGSVTKTRSIYDLAGLNYLIRYLILNNYDNINLIICPPTEIKKFASGKGNSQKDLLVEAFNILHPEFIKIKKIDDMVDAYFMCKYAINNKLNF